MDCRTGICLWYHGIAPDIYQGARRFPYFPPGPGILRVGVHSWRHLYTLSTWYVKRELAKRVAILFFGMFGANAISPLVASGILKLHEKGGLSGWQWIFLRK